MASLRCRGSMFDPLSKSARRAPAAQSRFPAASLLPLESRSACESSSASFVHVHKSFSRCKVLRAACFAPPSLLAVCKPNPPPKMALAVPCKTVGQTFSPVSREEWLQRGFFLTAGEPPLSSNALMALTSAAPLARNSLMRSRATCSSSFSPRGNSVTRTCLRSSRLRLRRT